MAHRVEHAGAGVDPALLEHDAHPLGEEPLLGARVETQDPDLSGGGTAVALADLDRAGLAGTVGAEHGRDLTGGGRERDAAQGLPLAVSHAQSGDLDGCHPVDATRETASTASAPAPTPGESWGPASGTAVA